MMLMLRWRAAPAAHLPGMPDAIEPRRLWPRGRRLEGGLAVPQPPFGNNVRLASLGCRLPGLGAALREAM